VRIIEIDALHNISSKYVFKYACISPGTKLMDAPAGHPKAKIMVICLNVTLNYDG